MVKSLCLVLALILPTVATASETPVPEIYSDLQAPSDMTLAEQALHRRAVEVAIWAQPLLNFKAMYDGLQDSAGVRYNGDIAYHSEIQDWRRALATPNNTTPYVFFFWDLRDGPVVLDIPPTAGEIALYGTMMDSWHRPIEEYGERGRDRGRGARYLLVPPGYTGQIPAAGYQVFNQETYFGYTLMRPLINDKTPATLASAVDLVKDVHVYPLAQADAPPESRHLDLKGLEVDGIVKWDASLYRHLHEILEHEYLEDKDLAMMGMLEAMGISKGQPYETNARRDEILDHAAKRAHEYMVVLYHGQAMIPSFYEGKSWGSILPPTFGSHGFAFQYPSHLDYNRRGSLYYAIFSSIKHYGPGSFYLDVAQDADGEWLFGSNNYKVTVPADVPVRRFWALTAYDLKTAAFIREVTSQGVSSIDEDLEVNPDGTVDLYIGPEAPKSKEANWIPTRAGEYFYMLFRFYGAENSIFTKEWQLNDIVKIN
ncbi:DUF1214 domain-containing protein [Roseibium alexandrii]